MSTVTDENRVQFQIDETGRWGRSIAIQVPPTRVQSAHRRTVRAYAKKARIKGFRQGKAPDHLIERQFAEQIERDVIEEVVREGLEDTLNESGLEPIVSPSFEDVRRTGEGAIHFRVAFDVRPEIELARTSGFRIDREQQAVTAADVDHVIERLREERAEWLDIDRAAAAGDRVVFESTPIGDAGLPVDSARAVDQRAVLGEPGLLPEFESGLTGLTPSASTRIEVRFPEQHPNEALRGTTRTFEIKVTGVQERELPDLDDSFAATLGAFDSVEALRAHIRKNLEAEAEAEGQRNVNEALIDEIIDANSIELPDSMIDQYLTNMLGDRAGLLRADPDPEHAQEIRRALRPGAERALRRYYILNHLADREGLRASDEDVDAAIAERVSSDGSAAEARRQLERSGELEDFRFHLTMERVFDWLRERSTISP